MAHWNAVKFIVKIVINSSQTYGVNWTNDFIRFRIYPNAHVPGKRWANGSFQARKEAQFIWPNLLACFYFMVFMLLMFDIVHRWLAVRACAHTDLVLYLEHPTEANAFFIRSSHKHTHFSFFTASVAWLDLAWHDSNHTHYLQTKLHI